MIHPITNIILQTSSNLIHVHIKHIAFYAMDSNLAHDIPKVNDKYSERIVPTVIIYSSSTFDLHAALSLCQCPTDVSRDNLQAPSKEPSTIIER